MTRSGVDRQAGLQRGPSAVLCMGGGAEIFGSPPLLFFSPRCLLAWRDDVFRSGSSDLTPSLPRATPPPSVAVMRVTRLAGDREVPGGEEES